VLTFKVGAVETSLSKQDLVLERSNMVACLVSVAMCQFSLGMLLKGRVVMLLWLQEFQLSAPGDHCRCLQERVYSANLAQQPLSQGLHYLGEVALFC